ncbi:MAG: hypothetical protein K2K13_05665 [Clostridiales bacterium]|nr:hypothetical protein [Clostridiales bacterium]
MIDIAKRKLPSPILPILAYISYCAAGWFAARGDLAYYCSQMQMGDILSHDAVAFFIGGLIPFALYMIIARFIFRTMHMRCGGDVRSIRYGLNFAVIAANLLLFALKFIYISAPLYSDMLEIILDPIVTIAFVSLYMWYAFKMQYVEKSRFRFVLLQVLGAFLAMYGLLALINLIVSVA